jgi:hypothetical protein
MDGGIFLFVIIVLIPLVVGILLLQKFTPGDAGFYRLAGCLTLKPLVTIPLLLWIAYLLNDAPRLLKASASIQPDIIITLLLMYRYRRLFAGQQARQAWGLVLVDGLRWGNSLLALLYPESGFFPLFFLIGILMPSIYAGAAYMLASKAYNY